MYICRKKMKENSTYKEKEICDEVLGTVLLRRNPRARHYILRVEHGQVIGTLPERGSEEEMLAFIRKKREKLLDVLKCDKRPLFDEQTDWQTLTFRLHIFRCVRSNFYMTLENGILHIACPETTDFDSPQVQAILRQMVTQALRHEANRVLPSRLSMLAKRYGFTYNGMTVRDMKTRWGSCSAKKHINLALSVMLLPKELIDYVLLHELCHTVEMNHGSHFRQLIDQVTQGQTQDLEKKLRKQRIL